MLNPLYMKHRASTPNPQVSYQPSTSSFQRHHRPSSPGISLGPPSSPPSLYNLQQIASATAVDQQNNDVEELSAERLNLYLDKQEGEIENLDDEPDEPVEKKWWQRTKTWFRLALPHFGLVLLSIGYTLIGALCFHHYEKPYEQQLRNETSRRVGHLKNRVMDQLWRMSNNGTAYSTWRQTANNGMDELIRDVFLDYTRNYMTPDDVIYGDGPVKWSFMSSIFFSWTAITTIGYGHIVPRTPEGRFAIILYALLGIPLILVTIADIGRFLAAYIIKLHHVYMTVMNFITSSCLKCIKWACCWIRIPRHVPMPTLELLQRTQKLYQNNNNNPTVAATAASAGGGTGRRKKQQRDNVSDAGTFDNISEINDGSDGGEGDEDQQQPPQFDPQQHEKRVSVLFILLIMLGYVAGGAYLVRFWEEWTFFEAFYFCFVTVTTIGFGDIVPVNVDWLPATLAYIVLGLIITTMCIDLVGSEYIRDIHFYGRSLGRQFMTIGGKVVHLGEVFGYVAFLQKNYGLTAEQLTKLSQLPEEYLLDCLINGRQPDLNWIGGRPYVPPDIYYFKWIEHPRTLSFASDRVLQSMESLDLNTSRCSTARTLTPREYYQKILFQYCKQLQPEEPIADIDN